MSLSEFWCVSLCAVSSANSWKRAIFNTKTRLSTVFCVSSSNQLWSFVMSTDRPITRTRMKHYIKHRSFAHCLLRDGLIRNVCRSIGDHWCRLNVRWTSAGPSCMKMAFPVKTPGRSFTCKLPNITLRVYKTSFASILMAYVGLIESL